MVVPRQRRRPQRHELGCPLLAVRAGKRAQRPGMAGAERLQPEGPQQHRRQLRLVDDPCDAHHLGEEALGLNLRGDPVPQRRQRSSCLSGGYRVAVPYSGREFVERPRRGRLGLHNESPAPRPHDDGAAVVPAVQRVAPVAHVSLVLGQIWLQLAGRCAGADLVVSDGEADLLHASVRRDPAVEHDVGLDHLLEVVVADPVVVEIVVVPAAPATVAALRLVGTPRFVDVRQRKRVVALGALCRRSEQCRARRIVAFQARPVQATARVLVIEQIDQATRALG